MSPRSGLGAQFVHPALREETDALTSHTLTLRRKARTVAGSGRFPETSSEIEVVGRLSSTAGARGISEQESGDQLRTEATHVFVSATHVEAEVGDEMEEEATGRVFDVEAVVPPSTDDPFLHIDLVEQQPRR